MKQKNKKHIAKYKFKQLKNKKEAVYQIPKFLVKQMGVNLITDSGMVQHEKQIYSKMYKIIIKKKNAGSISALLKKYRSMDYDFEMIRFYDEVWLQVFATYANISEAQDGFEVIEKEFMECAQKHDVSLENININQRLDFYVSSMCKLLGKDLNIESYKDQISEWKDIYNNFDFQKENNIITTENEKYSFVFVRKFPNNLTDKNSIIHIFEDIDNVIGIWTYYEMASDREVASFIRDRYVGYEGIMSRMKRKNPLMHKILTSTEPEKDEQCYVNASVCCLIKESADKDIKTIHKEICSAVEKQGYHLDFIYYEQKKMLDIFLGFGVNNMKISRLLPSEHMHCVFPVSTVPEEKEEYDIEAMKKLFLN